MFKHYILGDELLHACLLDCVNTKVHKSLGCAAKAEAQAQQRRNGKTASKRKQRLKAKAIPQLASVGMDAVLYTMSRAGSGQHSNSDNHAVGSAVHYNRPGSNC